MSITFPLTSLFTDHTIKTQDFKIFSRQEFSRTAGGMIVAKDYSRGLWMASFSSVVMNYADSMDLQALLQTLDGSVQMFEAHDTRRPYPRAHSSGVFGDTGVINSINANRKALTISGLDANFTLSRGDMFSFVHVSGGRSLHEVSETVQANGSGLTPEFECRPHLPDEAIPSMAVTLKKPVCNMLIEPQSVEYTEGASTLGTITFKAVQYL